MARHPVGADEDNAVRAESSAGNGYPHTRQQTASQPPWQREAGNLTPQQRKNGRTLNSITCAVVAAGIIGIIVTVHRGNSNEPVAPTPMQKCVASIKAQKASQVIGNTPACMKLTASERLAAITQAGPVAASKSAFPPKTLAAFRAFAATGDASKVHEIGKRTTGRPSCRGPAIYVRVSRALTGRALEADLSAFFVQRGLIKNRCQASVFAFHSRRDYRAHWKDGYTAGRVALTRNRRSGRRHKLEVDAGNITRSAGGIFHVAKFDFSF